MKCKNCGSEWTKGARIENELETCPFCGEAVINEIVFPDGVYEGEIKDGKKHGYGVFRHVDGDRYEGEWQNDKKHGNGIFYGVNGFRYEGEWKDDKPHGFGTEYDCYDDLVYHGEWKYGKWHGKGVWYNGSGVYQGEFKDGHPVTM